jgi:hypothetical protein
MSMNVIPSPEFEDDWLRGTGEIAEFLFGYADQQTRRSVYDLVTASRLPVLRVGARLFARKSELLAWIKEKQGMKAKTSEPSPAPALDLLRGADEIAEFLFGHADQQTGRKVHHLAETVVKSEKDNEP